MNETDGAVTSLENNRVESNRIFLAEAAQQEGVSWQNAVKEFDKLREVLNFITPEERIARLSSVLDTWREKMASSNPPSQPGFLLRLIGVREIPAEKNPVLPVEDFRTYLEVPTLENAVDILKMFPPSKSRSEALGEFTHRVRTVFFDQVMKGYDLLEDKSE